MNEATSDKRASILIIDDVTSNLIVLADIIREAGYTARPVTSVKQARQAIDAKLPDIILLDVTMPEVDGYEYCTILKKDVRTRDIPVIFISALNSARDRIRGFDCGAVDFISKPFERAEVLVRVNTHLKLYSMQTELEINNKKLHMLVNQQLYKLTEERRSIICSLAKLIETRDEGNENHVANISKNCRLLAMSLQFTQKYERIITYDFVSTIEIASQLHDIGKLVIADSILKKRGPLSEEENSEFVRHTEVGADTLYELYSANSSNSFIRMAADIANCHHERWDGKGFPKGLSGRNIPLAARITAVADTYDALVNKRCYKAAYTHSQAMSIIEGEAGKSFDPDIVYIMTRVQRQLKGAVPENAAEEVIAVKEEIEDYRK